MPFDLAKPASVANRGLTRARQNKAQIEYTTAYMLAVEKLDTPPHEGGPGGAITANAERLRLRQDIRNMHTSPAADFWHGGRPWELFGCFVAVSCDHCFALLFDNMPWETSSHVLKPEYGKPEVHPAFRAVCIGCGATYHIDTRHRQRVTDDLLEHRTLSGY